MEKPIQWIFGFGLIAWLLWAIMGSTPYVKLERGCSPVAWMGKVSVAVAGLASPGTEATTADMMDKVDSGCQRVLWTLFYGAEYNEAKRQRLQGDVYRESTESQRRAERAQRDFGVIPRDQR